MDNTGFEFGFDDAKVIKTAACETFKQSRPKEVSRICLIAFKKHSDVILVQRAREAGKPLTDAEKADLLAQVDTALSKKLGKPIDQLTEADRLDTKQPKFKFGFTHYRDGVGTIQCKGKYENGNLVQPAVCCDKMGDADQAVATVILQYPMDSDGQVDVELLKLHKYTSPYIWKLGSKKFKRLESVYVDARNDGQWTLDLKVELDGDAKYQKQVIQRASSAYWALDGTDPAIRNWVLEQGIRNWKYVQNNLGFDMQMSTLLEKLGQPQLASGQHESADKPQLQANYNSLID